MKQNTKTTILFSIIAVISGTIVMIIFSITRKTVSNTYTMNRNEDPGNFSGCPYWSFTGDQVCDDEANTEECHFDHGDCCDVQNDLSFCSDCFCYSAGHLINDTLIQNCPNPNQIHWYLGDGRCQIQLNNIQHLFDAGDCCLDSPECQLIFEGTGHSPYTTKVETIDIVCPEKVCIKSDVVNCIEEFKGDGICDDFNNSRFCEFDLRDCCGPNRHLDGALDACCLCACIPVIFYIPE